MYLILVIDVNDDIWVLLVGVDMIVFGVLIYMGGVLGDFKKFVDVLFKVWFMGVWKDKIVVGFMNFVLMNGDKYVLI